MEDDDSKTVTFQDLSILLSTEKEEKTDEQSRLLQQPPTISDETITSLQNNNNVPVVSNESNEPIMMTTTTNSTGESVSAVKEIEQEFERLALENEAKPTSTVIEELTVEEAPKKILQTRPSSVVNGIYFIRDIYFRGKRRKFLMQNDNGPCPLLAVCK